MAHSALSGFSTRQTPQNRPARSDQVANDAGGYGFAIDDKARARRFLTIGVESGTYYVNNATLVRDNATSLLRLASEVESARWLVDEAVAISTAGRAPSNNEALFALALVAGASNTESRRYALSRLSAVARTGTHLYTFAQFVEQFRGWGPILARGVAAWYEDKSVSSLEYQAVKYRQRDGWSHRDLLRLSHPRAPKGSDRASLFDWICRPANSEATGLDLVAAFRAAQAATTAGQVTSIILNNPRLPWEALPDFALNDADVWRTLIQVGALPPGAMIRQLPRLTRVGALADRETKRAVLRTISSTQELQAARIHPFKMLIALRTYAAGASLRGSSTWHSDADVIDALDAGFYASYGNVVPTGKRLKLALDVSGSMSWHPNRDGLTPREIVAAMALVTKATEGIDAQITAFSHQLVPINISPRQRLDDVLRVIDNIPMGGTDCSLPMVTATADNEQIDTFVVYTDNETWAGRIHPFQALQQYRQKSGINARLVVVATEATEFSIADPSDPGMIDVSGFDANTPDLISSFAREEF